MFTKDSFIRLKYSKNTYIVKYYNFYWNIFKMYYFPVMKKLNFQHYYSSLQCHML